MLKIGILAPGNSDEITSALKIILKSDKSIIAIKENNKIIKNELDMYEKIGINYVIIIFNTYKIYPVELDILILDNETNIKLVSYDLIKCVKENTYLIYNTDNNFLPYIEHPHAIDYGLSKASTVSISSIEYLEDSLQIIVSIQNSFSDIYSNQCNIGEFLIKVHTHLSVSNVLPAVICAILCNLVNEVTVKI